MEIRQHERDGHDDEVQVDLGGAGERTVTVTMTVNGERVEHETSTRRLLSDFLRHDLRLRGTHVGCEHGVCGCCTVLVDGETARSCLLLAAQCDGAEVTTIEGLSPAGGGLSVVQEAFREAHGLQCGFCTPGFVVAVTDFLAKHEGRRDFTDDELRDAVAGNLCRCTGYQGIVAAVRLAAERLADGAAPARAPAPPAEPTPAQPGATRRAVPEPEETGAHGPYGADPVLPPDEEAH